MKADENEIVKRTTPPFAVVPAAALLDKRLSNAQRYVFSMMCLHANAQHYCWPKVETLADEMGVTKQAVSKTIHQLVKLGYVQIERHGFPSRNRYRIAFDRTPQSQPDVATDVSASTVNLTLTHSQPDVDQQSTSEVDREHTNRTDQKNIVSEENLLVTSLARTAPPERRTRERLDLTTLKRDPLISALAACLGREPLTHREWDQWRLAVNDLHSAHVCADDIPRAIKGFQTAYPRARITPFALVKHWSEIQGGTPHDLAQLEISRRAAEVEERARHERERRERERKAEQEREVKRLLVEYGYATGS